MAQWTADHVDGQFYAPRDKRQSLCGFVVERVMVCDGNPETCEPGDPSSIDLAVEDFKQQLQEG